jgi:DnaJ family protein C protein 17
LSARKFHELNQAYELLLDPLRRLALDAKLRLKKARDERFAGYDAKRKALVVELEEKEREFKKARMDKQKEETERWHTEERIKEEGRKLKEERANEIKRREMEMDNEREKAENDMAPPTLGMFFSTSAAHPDLRHYPGTLDTTVRLKYTTTNHPTLITPASISAFLQQFGATDIDSIVLSIKPPKKAPTKAPKFATALVPFNQIGDAFAAVCASGRPERGLEGIEVGWAEGKEPEILGWLKKIGKLGAVGTPQLHSLERSKGEKAQVPQAQTRADSSTFSSFPGTFVCFSMLSLLEI